MAIDVTSPLSFDFTPENLAELGMDQFIPGDYLSYRIQARRQSAALDLTGATLVMSVRRRDSGSLDATNLVFQRRSIDNIGGGWSPTTKQIVLDDQTSENTDDTGRGWFALNFAPTDEALLLTSLGRWFYDVRAQWSSTKLVRTVLRGRIVIAEPRTLVAAFT